MLYRASCYYCDQPSSFSQAPSACGVQCSTEHLVWFCTSCLHCQKIVYIQSGYMQGVFSPKLIHNSVLISPRNSLFVFAPPYMFALSENCLYTVWLYAGSFSPKRIHNSVLISPRNSLFVFAPPYMFALSENCLYTVWLYAGSFSPKRIHNSVLISPRNSLFVFAPPYMFALSENCLYTVWLYSGSFFP